MSWSIKINDVLQADFSYVKVLDTIAGIKKCDIIFSGSDKAQTFNHYDDIKIYGENSAIVFRGRIEEMDPKYNDNTTEISGKDYLSVLLDKFVVEAYTTKLRSYIVNDIVTKNSDNLTRTNVQNSPSGTELTYTFKSSVWDVLIQCAAEDEYRFWVDVNNDLHYVPKGYTDSGLSLTLGTSDIISFKIEERSGEIVNRITIYGGGTPQVVLMLEDMSSQTYYGVTKEKRIIDDQIDTETLATTTAQSYLNENAWVLDIIEFEVDGYETLNAGELIHVTLSTHSIDGDYLVISKEHNFPSNVTRIRVARYAKNLESIIANLVDRILKLEQSNIDASAVMTRIERFYETIVLTDTYKIYQIDITGFRIGNDGFSNLGKSKLGAKRSVPTVIRSG